MSQTLTQEKDTWRWLRFRRVAQHQRQIAAAFLFLAPGVVLLTIFFLVPLISVVVLSFTDYDLSAMRWVGLDNYIQALRDEQFLRAIRNTAYYAMLNIPGQMLIGLVLALILNEKLRMRGLFRMAYYFPVVTSMVVVAMVWLWIYEPGWGLLNILLRALRLESQNWLADPDMAMLAVIFMSVWKGLGNAMILFLAGLQGIPEVLYEAAKIDGADRWQRFRNITLPMLQPTTFFIFVMYCIWAFQVFDQVYIMTKGGPMWSTTTMVYQVYRSAFLYIDMGRAATMATILLVIVLIITLFNLIIFRGKVEYW
jgi:ABC-type sugar transport system permease subunit